MSRILHIIDRLSGGGPTRSMIALAKYQRQGDLDHEHRIIALAAPAYPLALLWARQAGATVLIAPQAATLHRELAEAEILQLHFWNNPALYEFIRAPLPSLRLLLWLKILGSSAPQIATPKLLSFAGYSVATTPASLKLPAFNQALAKAAIPALADFSRLADARLEPHAGFNITYIGTLNFSKLHPAFVSMSASLKAPEALFQVCGATPGSLEAQVAALGQSERFVFHGFVENIKPILQTSDVFGYPLCADTYATSEKSLQEAMWLGIPPVVFPYGGIGDLVRHEQTGLVAHDEGAYTAALERLHHDPALRRRLGQQAQEYARAEFDPGRAAAQFDQVYQSMLRQPKRQPVWEQPVDNTPSGWFIEALGDAGAVFSASKNAPDDEAQFLADSHIADASTTLANGEGGVQHYRNTYPTDPFLRYWSALILLGRGRDAAARDELAAAQHYGLNDVDARRFVRSAAR